MLRSTQLTVAIVTATGAFAALSVLASLRWSTAAVLALGVVGVIYGASMTALWLIWWPTRRQSELSVIAGVLFIGGWGLNQPTATVALLACMATAVTGGYIAFFHSMRILLVNFAVAAVLAASTSWRLAGEVNSATALAAFWQVLFLNMSVPLAIRGMSRTMGAYANRSDADPLTELLNRRGFAAAVGRQLADSQATDSHLTVVMVDIDDFKRVNDTYGHAAGDRALLAVAELLRRHSPPNAAICRSGGEEILIALTPKPLGLNR